MISEDDLLVNNLEAINPDDDALPYGRFIVNTNY